MATGEGRTYARRIDAREQERPRRLDNGRYRDLGRAAPRGLANRPDPFRITHLLPGRYAIPRRGWL